MTNITDQILQTILHTSIAEWFAFLTALIYIILVIKENAWCWWFGNLSCAVSIYLCIQGQLYLESGLQLFYIAAGIYGWLQWTKKITDHKTLPIQHLPINTFLFSTLIGLPVWAIVWWLSSRFSNQALPLLDSFITTFSLIATWLTAKKYIENWIYWFLIDALAIYLYISRGFYLIGIIYLIYTVLTVSGYVKWKKQLVK